MQKWILPVTATALLIAPAFAQKAFAPNRPVACQADKSAGLGWENGRWETASFFPKPDRFILVSSGKSVTPESVQKVLNEARPPNCIAGMGDGEIFCVSSWGSGSSLLFSMKTMKGAIAKLYGGIMTGEQYRDTVSVSTFTCQPF